MKRAAKFLWFKVREVAAEMWSAVKDPRFWLMSGSLVAINRTVQVVFGNYWLWIFVCVELLVLEILFWAMRHEISAWLADNWRRAGEQADRAEGGGE